MTTIASAVLRPKQGAAYLAVSLPTFWGWAKKDPTFPKLFKIGPNSTAVMRADLDAWLESKRGGAQ